MRRPSPTTIRLFVLATACFTFVTTETQPVALLAPMARGLHEPESTIGLLMTAYAGVAAITAIPLTVLASRIPRRRLVIATVALLVVSQAGLALAPDYAVALGARLLGALAHGVFWSVLAQVIASLVPRERLGRATAATLAGNSIALVAGTPLVAAVGALVGWRAAVAVMGVIGLVVVVAMAFALPEIAPAPSAGDRRTAVLARALRHRGVLLVSSVTVLLAFAHFVTFTYLAPLVRAHTGITGAGMSVILLIYGLAGLVSIAVAGHLSDRRPRAAVLGCCIAVCVGTGLLAAVAHGLPAMLVAVIVWGGGFTALPICLQSTVLRVAPDIPDTASAVYVVAFQIGIGGGALTGSRLLGSGHLSLIPVVSFALFAAGTLVAAAARRTFAGDEAAVAPGGAISLMRRRVPGVRTAPHTSLRRTSVRGAIRSPRLARPRARR